MEIGPVVRKSVFVDADAKPPTFKGHPKAIDKIIRCPVCNGIIVETSIGNWGCQNGFDHSKTKTDIILARQIEKAIPEIDWDIYEDDDGVVIGKNMRQLLRLIKRRSMWMGKVGATDAQIDMKNTFDFGDTEPEK